MADPTIAEATGHAGGNHGPIGPLIELAMSQAVLAANALGICDDTPAARVEELTGAKGWDGATYIREAKMTARQGMLDQHRGLIKAHEAGRAAAQHAARDA